MLPLQNRTLTAFGVLLITTMSHARPNVQSTIEGFDKQTPQEIEQARNQIKSLFHDAISIKSLSKKQKEAILARYQHLDPKNEVPSDLLEEAVLYFDQNLAKFPNPHYISVIDFGVRSDRPRFFVVNVGSGLVEKFRTTHGLNSDKNNNGYAESFGNVINSGKSSLGFIRTAEIYEGKFKRSVRLDGLSTTNSNIRERAIVLHGWDDVHEKPVIQGLSWGCPTLDWAVKDGVIDKVANGSLMYMGVAD